MVWITLIGLGLLGLLAMRYWYVPFLQNPEHIDLQKLGFKVTTEAHKQRVRNILNAFFQGFNAMFTEKNMAGVRAKCDSLPSLFRPFAQEGAAMSFGIKTVLRNFGNARNFEKDIQSLSPQYYLMYYIGLGFCTGMIFRFLPSRVRHLASQLDPFYKYLCYDGFGFKIGLFNYLKNPNILKLYSKFEGYEKHACYQGFGRSLWFIFRDAPASIEKTIAMQEPSVRGDCYSGLGLAVTFTNMDDLRIPFDFSERVECEYLADYFLGVMIALYTRREIDASYLNECLEGIDPGQRSFAFEGLRSCDRHFADVAAATSKDHYEIWRRSITEDLKVMTATQTAMAAS
jgi:enediyne biosynthesis protein E3